MMSNRNNESVFSSKRVEGNKKSQFLIQLLSAFREGASKAIGTGTNITYSKAIKILAEVNIELYADISDFVTRGKPESTEVKEFNEKAQSRGEDPVKLIEEEIRVIEQDINNESKLRTLKAQFSPKFTTLRKRLIKLHEALEFFKLEKELQEFVEDFVAKENEIDSIDMVEQKVLNRDYFLAHRDRLIYKPLKPMSDDYVEFLLSNNRLMRIRLWHNLKPESMTGVDLVYEQIDIIAQKMRFIHLQYKMWDDNKLILTSRDKRQMERMQGKFCESGYCSKRKSGELFFRMPFCCVFYRPTSKKQSKNAQLITSGIHLPVCQIAALTSQRRTISRNVLYEQGLSNLTFDELFRNGLIGSTWMDIRKVEKFYKDNEVLSSKDSMVLNIKEEFGHDKLRVKSAVKLRDVIS